MPPTPACGLETDFQHTNLPAAKENHTSHRYFSMYSFFGHEPWVLETRGLNGTQVIGVSFIFLAYFLHPAVESAYQRVRAYRAWRAIEKREVVEVTHYSTLSEMFGGRERWDAARIITALLAVFSLASWGLELSMELAPHTGPADLLNRPPPVEVVVDTSGLTIWKVSRMSCLTEQPAP